MDPSKQKVRFNFERLELRDTPAQLGMNVALPQLPAEGVASDAAVTIPADVSDGGASVKLDPISLVRVKLDPAANVKLDPASANVKLDPTSLVNVKLDPSASASVKLDPASVSVKLDPASMSVKIDTGAGASVKLDPVSFMSVKL